MTRLVNYGNFVQPSTITTPIVKLKNPVTSSYKKLNEARLAGGFKHKVDFNNNDLGISYYENSFNKFMSDRRFKAFDLVLLSIVNSYIVTKFNKDYNGQTITINNLELQDYLGNTRLKKDKLVKSCERLTSIEVSFGENNENKTKLFTSARYDNGWFYLVFNRELSKYLIDRDTSYTKVDNNYLFKLYRESNNAEAIRLFQYMSTFKGFVYQYRDHGKNPDYRFKKDFTFTELCGIAGIDNSDVATVKTYNRDRNRDRIIQSAINRINEATNMCLELNYGLEELEDGSKVVTNSIYMTAHFTQYDKLRPEALSYFENEMDTCLNAGGYIAFAKNNFHAPQLRDLFDYLKKHKDYWEYSEEEKRIVFAGNKVKDKIIRKFIHIFTNRFVEKFEPLSTKAFHYKERSKVEKFDKDFVQKRIKIQSSSPDISLSLSNMNEFLRQQRHSGRKFGKSRADRVDEL